MNFKNCVDEFRSSQPKPAIRQKGKLTVADSEVASVEKIGPCSSARDLDRYRRRNLLRDYRIKVMLNFGCLDRYK